MVLILQNFISEDLVHYMIDMVIQNPREAMKAKISVIPVFMAMGGCELQHPNLQQALNILVNHNRMIISEV